jgi:putative SOS response-associated peptidase YedK
LSCGFASLLLAQQQCAKSRSVSVALMVVFRLEKISLKESFAALFRVRRCIQPNEDLWAQLVEMTRSDKNLKQDDCKQMFVAATKESEMIARNESELLNLFNQCAQV